MFTNSKGLNDSLQGKRVRLIVLDTPVFLSAVSGFVEDFHVTILERNGLVHRLTSYVVDEVLVILAILGYRAA